MTLHLPLAGVRVIAVEQYGAGPFGSQFLADQGAEVIKVENPSDGGDMARGVGPHFAEKTDGTRSSLFFESFNRNKRSVTIDLAHAEGHKVFAQLAASADGVVTNLRGDVAARLGLDYAALQAHKPSIVCAHLSAYGRTGPRAHWPGYDYLMQAEAGWFSLTGEPDTPPTRFGLSVVDMMTGLALAFAFTTALVDARATGRGRDMDVSLYDVALHNLSYLATWYLNAGHAQARLPRSAHPSLVPCQLYRTADGWVFLMCNKEKFWPALCKAMERDDLGGDSRFANFAGRLEHRDLLTELLDEALGTRTTAEWLERFAGSVPAAPVLDVAAALENPFAATLEHQRITEMDGGFHPPLREVATPVKSGAQSSARPAPGLGADTDDVLGALGLDVAALRQRGVV